MRLRVKLILLGAAICSCSAASAQDALDVTAPPQAEERRDDHARVKNATRIKIAPVLEGATLSSNQPPVAVSAIVIDGLAALRREDFADIITEFAGRSLSREDLVRLTTRIAQAAQSRGYIFASANVPPQSLAHGVLHIALDEGTIDEIRIEGSSDPAIAAQLAPLRNGKPVALAELERQIMLADDLPGVYIKDTRFVREGQKGVLLVEAYRQDWYARATLSNAGTKPQGPLRAHIEVDANGLLSNRDGVTLTFGTTPLAPDELVYFSTRYTVVVNSAGTQLAGFGSYTHSRPGAYLDSLAIVGKSWRAGVALRQPLIRSRSAGLWLDASFEAGDLMQDQLGMPARHDRISLARIGAYAYFPALGGQVRSRITVTQGLDILGATAEGDPLASRTDAKPDFTTLGWWVNFDRQLPGNFSLSLNATGQFSTAPLLIGESSTLGGNFYLRGYDFASRVGDQGVMGVGELRYDWQNASGAIDNLQFYAFADGGVVSNLKGGSGGGSLASSGAGLRADLLRTLYLGFEVAVPLTGPRYDTGDKSPRFNMQVSKSF